jgi:FtsP/CotA-like multicopper oxidase with cupredoxin domain
MKINGPASANYDEDLGTYPISDWYHTTVFQNALYSQLSGGSSPIADNGLINGHMVAPEGFPAGGKYSKTTLVKGKKYRLRLINTSVDNHFRVSLDGHQFEVISSDFVPITPYTTTWLFLAIGQRYDVIITAGEAVDNYWFRAAVQIACSATNNNNGAIQSIFHYEGAPDTNPTSEATEFDDSCQDEKTLVPIVTKAVPTTGFADDVKSLVADLSGGVNSHGDYIVHWRINGVPIEIDWDVPTLQYVADGNTSYPTELNVIQAPNKDQWYYWIIQGTDVPNSHPIHLHGHDFSVLGSGGGTFDPSTLDGLNFVNPARRDVVMMPQAGWVAIAFEADNPGAWLMHCHIAWHVAQGVAVQFVEQESAIKGAVDLSVLTDTCDAWGEYQTKMAYPMDDSGL